MKIVFLALGVLFSFCPLNKVFSWNIEPVEKKVILNPRINLVFCPHNYSDREDFLRDIDMLLERLSQTKPFDGFMDGIMAWKVSLLNNESKEFFKEAADIPPLKVRQDFLDGILNHLKTDYKLIIIDAQGSVSCAELSTQDKVSLIILGKRRYTHKHSFAKGFLHELGHSFGLRDECIDCGQLSPPGAPNCAGNKEEAQKFWGDLAGKVERVRYINGCCGNKDYIRPTIASLMNNPDKAEDFGPVNERFLREELGRN